MALEAVHELTQVATRELPLEGPSDAFVVGWKRRMRSSRLSVEEKSLGVSTLRWRIE